MDRLEQTICALATPPGEGGLAVIRVSGPDAYPIVEKVFVPFRQGRRVAARCVLRRNGSAVRTGVSLRTETRV